MKRQITPLIIALLLSVSLCVAAPFDYTITSVKNVIYPDETAVFNVTLMNFGRSSDTFVLLFDDVLWSVITNPQSYYNSGVTMFGRQDKSFLLTLRPIPNIRLDSYAFNFGVRSENTGETKNKVINVNVLNPGPFIPPFYEPEVSAKIVFDPEQDPRDKMVINVELKNENLANLTGIVLHVRSSLFEKQRPFINLRPLERKTEEFAVDLDPLEKPINDAIVVFWSLENKTLGSDSVEYSIIGYSNFVEDASKSDSFMKHVEQISIVNEGNEQNRGYIEYPASFFKRMFTSAKPKASIVDKEGGKFYVWQPDVAPQEQYSVTITENYRPILYILTALVIIVVLYYLLRSPVVVKKSASLLAIKEGGIDELKVALNVKNRGGKEINELKIIDRIPHITELGTEFAVGTLKPSKIINRGKEGTVMHWDIGKLEGSEERIITYRIKAKLSILGGIDLPPAKAKYPGTAGNMATVYSNRIRLTEQ